jgi:hypothetical protein
MSTILENKRVKVILGGVDYWLDKTGYPSIWLYPSETATNGIPVDVLYDGKLIGSSSLNNAEKRDLLDYLNTREMNAPKQHWKQVYERMFFNTRKSERRTKSQIINIRGLAKIYCCLFPCK